VVFQHIFHHIVFVFEGAQLHKVGGKSFQQEVNDLLSKIKSLDTAAGLYYLYTVHIILCCSDVFIVHQHTDARY